MTLNEYCEITHVLPARTMRIYEYSDYDNVSDRLIDDGEYSSDVIDEYCVFSLSTTQTYTLKTFIKDKFADAYVMEQIIYNDGLYVFIEVKENKER